MITWVGVVLRRTVCGDIDWSFNNLSGRYHQNEVTLDSDDDFCSGCRNVSQCHHKQSFSGLHSPGVQNSSWLPALWPLLLVIFHPRNRKNYHLDWQNQRPWNIIVNVSYQKVVQPWNTYTHTKSELDDVNNNYYCLDSCKSSLRSSNYLYLPALFFFGVVSYVIDNATFVEIGQTRCSSSAAIQFSFRNRANFHSQSLCYQCVFNPVPLSTLSLFSCAFAFSSNLIC